jgi:hypothetical protein
MSESALHCRHCGWEATVRTDRIPRYGARICCPECGGLQLLEPPQPAAAAAALATSSSPPAQEPAPIQLSEDTGPTRSEARQLLLLWLQELAREDDRALSPARLFRDHADELAHLFSLWERSFPGGRATEIFREQLFEALDSLASGQLPRFPSSPDAEGRP